MKKQLVALVSRSLLALLLMCGLATADDAPQLQKLKHTVLSPTSEQVVLQLNGSYSPKVFTLKDENPRIVFDFADMTYGKEIKGVTATNGSIVKRVRVGMHVDGSSKTRIVFDVASLKGVNFTQKFDEKSSSLVIQFTGPAKAVPPRAQETQTGTGPQKEEETAAAAVAPQAPNAAAETGTNIPREQPAPPKESAAEQTGPEQQARPQPQTEPAPAVIATVKPDSPKPVETTAAAPTKEPVEPPAAQKTEEKHPVPPVPPKPDASAAATPEKEVAATTAPPATDEKKEEKKTAPAAKEPSHPETPAKAIAPQAGDKGKTEAAKTVAPPKTMEGPQLEYVKFESSPSKGEMVLFKLNGFHPPAVHGVEEGIPRVICDFNNTRLIDGTKSLIKVDGKFVKVIRTSKTKKPEKVRVVIDLEPNRSYDLQQVFFKEDNLFVLIVNTVKK